MKDLLKILNGTAFAGGGNGNGGHAARVQDRLTDVIGPGKRVLYVGLPSLPVLLGLRDGISDVVLVEAGVGAAAAEASLYCERVISRGLGARDLADELKGERFDVVVLDGDAARTDRVSELLPLLSEVIGPPGMIVGLLPRAEEDLMPQPDSLEQALAEAGYVAVHVDPTGPGARRLSRDLLGRNGSDRGRRRLFVAYRFEREEVGLISRRLRSLTEAREQAEKDHDEARAAINELHGRLERAAEECASLEERVRRADRDAAVAAAEPVRLEVGRLLARDAELRRMLLDTHEQLLQRDDELAAALAARGSGEAVDSIVPDEGYLRYREVVLGVRELVRTHVPLDATVAVVSKGDEELLELDGRTGWHLPQAAGGVYAGHHPADSKSAIAELEALRARGAAYLLVPAPQLWWLDHYQELAEHLDLYYRLAARDHRAGVVYDLSVKPEFLAASG